MGTRRSVGESIRAALTDLLAYKSAFAAEITDPSRLLGVAWGAGIEPQDDQVMLATDEGIGAALGYFLDV